MAAGWDVVGFDIERHVYGEMRYPAQLVLQDVLTIHGSQFHVAGLIVASPPCQEFSYWHQFSWKAPNPKLGIELFRAAFRIQQEASERAGRHIPFVVENVIGAQRWVGPAKNHYGSFYLWGDVPALMPYGSPVKGFKRDMKQTPFSRFSSKSKERKAASALIAKIPFDLAHWIGQVYRPGADLPQNYRKSCETSATLTNHRTAETGSINEDCDTDASSST